MPWLWMDILAAFFLACAIASVIFWSSIAVYTAVILRKLPSARDGIELAEQNPPTARVCVIVPAHNEAGNIATLIRSLRAQDYDRLRVVLALDRCTDDTAGVARDEIGDDHRFEVFEIDECPDDWAGKVHAAHCGFTRSEHASSAHVLIFTDADTWFDPSCVRASVALAEHRELDLLSLFSTLTTETWFEQTVQLSASFELARQFPLNKVNKSDRESRRAFANGQFMLFTSDCYRAIGGHEAVKDAILEDIAFARKVYHNNLRGGLLFADNMLRCSMYDSWSEFVRGWKRIYTESANREIKRLRRYSLRAPITGSLLPIGSLCCVAFALAFGDTPTRIAHGVIGSSGLAAWISAMIVISISSRSQIRHFPKNLLGALLVGWIFRQAASDLSKGNPTQWGGKAYKRVSAEEELAGATR